MVIKFTKSRKLPRHFFYSTVFRYALLDERPGTGPRMLIRKTPADGLGFTLRCILAQSTPTLGGMRKYPSMSKTEPYARPDVVVASVTQGTEAYNKGVRKGSRLMEIDLQDVFGLSFEEVSEVRALYRTAPFLCNGGKSRLCVRDRHYAGACIGGNTSSQSQEKCRAPFF